MEHESQRRDESGNPQVNQPLSLHPSIGGSWLEAFIIGGVGCLLAFITWGVLLALSGGRAWMDFGGVCCLLFFGGCVGLIVRAAYRRGWQAGNLSNAGSEEVEKGDTGDNVPP